MPDGEAAKRRLLGDYISSAKERNKEFALSEEQFYWLVKQNCHYCGSEPLAKKRNKFGYGDYIYNGIDRVDNNIGYTFDNCVSCCKFCNKAKSTYELNEFIEWIKRVKNFNLSLM